MLSFIALFVWGAGMILLVFAFGRNNWWWLSAILLLFLAFLLHHLGMALNLPDH